jgi:uncharacterized protein (TIGR03435 family)
VDEDAPLKPGEMKMDTPDGPIRMTQGKDGSASVDMGPKGKMNYRMDPSTMSMHLEADGMKMEGLVEMLTQFSNMGGSGGRTVVDMTELKGSYVVALDFSLADLISMARAAGANVPNDVLKDKLGPSAVDASDPSGSSSLSKAVQALGLKLEQRRAPAEQLIIDHVEKLPTEN